MDVTFGNPEDDIGEAPELSSFLEVKLEFEAPIQTLPYVEIGDHFQCTVCSDVFKNKEMVQNHLKFHSSELTCPTCEITFEQTEFKEYHIHLNSHTRRGRPPKYGVKTKEETGIFICESCAKSFKTKQQLVTHSVVHTDIKPFSCELCEKSFKLKQQLKNHTKVHEDIKPFACFLCDKAFKLKQQLGNHSKTHSDIRPFPCIFCEKSFKIKQQLQTHLRVHDDLRPFECELCFKAFKLKQQLQFHMRVHTNERPYSCEHCDKSFKFKQQLQHHYKKHNKEVEFNIKIEEETQLSPAAEMNLEESVDEDLERSETGTPIDLEDLAVKKKEIGEDLRFKCLDENNKNIVEHLEFPNIGLE